MTLAIPKTGLMQDNSKECVGRLYIADISVPPELYKDMGINSGEIFTGKSIISII